MKFAALLTLICVTMCCRAAENPERQKREEEAVRQFSAAFFSENPKVVDFCARELETQLRAYFWFKSAIHRNDEVVAQPWNGKIEILSVHHGVLVLYESGEEQSEDAFFVSIDEKKFEIHVDARNKVTMFQDYKPKEEKK